MTITWYRTGAGARTRAGGRKGADIDSGNFKGAMSRKLTGLILVFCFCLSNSLGAQRPGARDPKDPNVKSDERPERLGTVDKETKPQRATPLGIQVPVDRVPQRQGRVVAAEALSSASQRVGISHGSSDEPQADRVADGTVTVHTASGPIVFSVTLVQNGEHGSQRILLTQPDGRLWDGRADHLAPGAGQALLFLETQYRRGLQQFLESPERDAAREVTVLEEIGESTRYTLDPATPRMTRFEFVRGKYRDLTENESPTVHSYAFADFRAADGVATPFHVTHSVDSVKQEELQLTKVRYNAATISVPVTQPKGR